MIRGIDRQQIFEDEEDYTTFIKILEDVQEKSKFELFAYCLMGNHVHLMIKEGEENIETVFKRIGGKYVYYYNTKYERTGHLFGDRFKSEPIDTDSYFIVALRYIHQNPLKAGICSKIEDYPYSSYAEYTQKEKMINTEYVFSILPKEEFFEYVNAPNDDVCLEIETVRRKAITDEQAKKIIKKISGCSNVTEFQNLDAKHKQKSIQKIHQKGVSIRQINRLTGISKKTIELAIKQ
jgi:REP element-mobilizing transposase RayT